MLRAPVTPFALRITEALLLLGRLYAAPVPIVARTVLLGKVHQVLVHVLHTHTNAE